MGPHVPFNDCPAQGMRNCPGPMDPMGMECMTADTCIPLEDMCPFYCPYVPPMDCGEGMMNCPGWEDSMGCKTADACVPHGETCPHYCSYFPPTDCGQGMMNCPGGVDSMGCQMGDTCIAYG